MQFEIVDFGAAQVAGPGYVAWMNLRTPIGLLRGFSLRTVDGIPGGLSLAAPKVKGRTRDTLAVSFAPELYAEVQRQAVELYAQRTGRPAVAAKYIPMTEGSDDCTIQRRFVGA